MWGRRKNEEIAALRAEVESQRTKLRTAWLDADKANEELSLAQAQFRDQREKTALALQSVKDAQNQSNAGMKALQDKMYDFEKEQKTLLAWLLDFAPSEILSDPAQSGTVYALALSTLKAWSPERTKLVVKDDTIEEDNPSLRRTPAPRGRK